MEVQEVKEQLKAIFRTVINNDKWITKYDKEGEPYHVNLDDTDDKKDEKIEKKKESKNKYHNYLESKINDSWYKNAKLDYGVEGKLLDTSLKDDTLTITWEEKQPDSEKKKYKMDIPYASDYTNEQLYDIWSEQSYEPEEIDNKDKQSDKKEEKYEIPKDYKDSVKGYSKEKHEQAADFYGEKMATVQKKSVAHPDNEDYRKQFEEYKALKDYHEEKAKSDSKGDLDIKKTTVKMKSGKEKEIEYVDSVPEGYKKLEGAMTAPLGYTWYHNGKSIIDKERKTILVKDKVNNNKEQDMALLEELKKLITKVENDKGEKDMEIENEKVDKRDIIRQIMAIAGKEEASEDVKTIAKLAEKLAYDKSEAGTADNKCKNEDGEEEVKEVKEEVKEDVENKCKNSVDNAKVDYFAKLNEIYNATSQVKKEASYVSRADREKAAEDYFAK